MDTNSVEALASAESELEEAFAKSRAGSAVPQPIEAEYRRIFDAYLSLATGPNFDIEALKRATFLAWYAVSEPVWLTGLGALPADAVAQSIELVEQNTTRLDDEFRLMLDYYFMWEFAFPDLAQYPKVATLSRGLHVDDILPHIQPEEMSNRGLMGSYFLSVSDSYDRRRK